MLTLIHPPVFYEIVAIGSHSPLKAAVLYQLTQGRFGADRGLFALTVSQQEADVIGELVGMIVKPLLPLLGAPDLYAVLDKPLHNKGGLVCDTANAVKHEHQQDVKLPLAGVLFDDLELVPVLRPDLMAGNTVLLFLVKWSSPFPLRSGGRLFSA